MDEITLAGALIAGAHVAKPLVEVGARLLESLLGKPCKVAGSLLADEVYRWQ